MKTIEETRAKILEYRDEFNRESYRYGATDSRTGSIFMCNVLLRFIDEKKEGYVEE